MTVADARAGLEMARPGLVGEVAGGETYWSSEPMDALPRTPREAFLLPAFDELLIGYSSSGASRTEGWGGRKLAFSAPVLLGGGVVAAWRRVLKKRAVLVQVAPLRRLTPSEFEEVAAAAERYGRFIGLPSECETVKGPE